MSNRKLARAIQGLFQEIWKLYRTVTKKLVNWLLRTALMTKRRSRFSNAGFVLPTTVLLILVVLLTVGALTFRAYNRNTQVIGQNQQRVIYNAATPAIDRARAKIEFMFDPAKDTRYPGGVPPEGRLLSMMLNDGKGLAPFKPGGVDPYTLPDEKRIDIGGTNADLDNAWYFRTDTNGDGAADATVIYSVIFNSPTDTSTGADKKKLNELLLSLPDKDKADKLWIRHGPLSNETKGLGCNFNTGNNSGLQGWFDEPGGTSVLKKNFQVDAYVVPDSANATAVTLEFQQDRQLDRGNKWGAWFRNDLEIHPGPAFNWNGAMHTEGSLIVGSSVQGADTPTSSPTGGFIAHLVSAPASCLYYPDASVITATNVSPSTGETNRDLIGTVVVGQMRDNTVGGSAKIHLHSDRPANNFKNLERGTISVPDSTKLTDIAIDPKTVLIEDGYRSQAGGTNRLIDQDPIDTKLKRDFPLRISRETQPAPYVDDLYRADDRWGPKPRYDNKNKIAAPTLMGDKIVGNDTLTAQTPPTADDVGAVGLDGYWERRARNEGLRVLVGERLELGNLNTWFAPRDLNGNDLFNVSGSNLSKDSKDPLKDERPGDSLIPPNLPPYVSTTLSHVDLQRRTLRDNLAAVQATAIYHADKTVNSAVGGNIDYPLACLASTTHPGTLSTLRQSINFVPTQFISGAGVDPNEQLLTNFFTGRGTNGWEFEPPLGTATAFESAMNNASSPLRIALTNLANFAGDPSGAYPPVQDANIHPYPALSMWGNYSNLRRSLELLSSGSYSTLSIADKTYLQTAACTIGMLAYNIDQIQKFDPANPANDLDPTKVGLSAGTPLLTQLAQNLDELMDGDVTNGEVVPKGQLSTYNGDPNKPDAFNVSTNPRASYEPKDYIGIPPEAFIGALKQKRKDFHLKNDPVVRMAELIMLKYQIRRDRTFGFRPSPAFGDYTTSGTDHSGTFKSACDPDDFAIASASIPGTTALVGPTLKENPLGFADKGSDSARYRVALSRLCGTLDLLTTDPNGRVGVLPKFPSLYYLFPETAHGVEGSFDNTVGGLAFVADQPGEYDHRQPGNTDLDDPSTASSSKRPPEVTLGGSGSSRVAADREPYVRDSYVRGLSPVQGGAGNQKFRPVQTGAAPGRGAFTDPIATDRVTPSATVSRKPDTTRVLLPVPDLLVSGVKISPRNSNFSDWMLPVYETPFTASDSRIAGGPNISTNLILAPNPGGLTDKRVAVGFLDRALFDGRQLMLTRVMDIDLGMLRTTQVKNGRDTWLPISGVTYAFREDAVREDAIARPKGGTQTNLTVASAQTDPEIEVNATNRGVSTKPVDYMPDPERRLHGFRLRNGSQIKRDSKFEGALVSAGNNVRGLSFFTDQPVYIQGDFNLHQNGGDDTAGALLEEFTEQLPTNRPYTADYFYNTRKTIDSRFANFDSSDVANKDRWRPSEILADSISILSNQFCDGTIADTFVRPKAGIPSNSSAPTYPVPDFEWYTTDAEAEAALGNYAPYGYGDLGLFGPGCGVNSHTSFHNQNRPNKLLSADTDWVRENSSDRTLPQRSINYLIDFTSPIKISRTGQPIRESTQTAATGSSVGLPRPVAGGLSYFDVGGTQDRRLINPQPVRVNSIIVSGINPSRAQQGYGGLHNFPRFLEQWQPVISDSTTAIPVYFAGSFLQLSYTNYATAPYEQEGFEPGVGAQSGENIPYYKPPGRFWGYDVGLQFVPAGPAAARFVTASKNRNEYYSEPPANDPYINKLCSALKTTVNPKINCPNP